MSEEIQKKPLEVLLAVPFTAIKSSKDHAEGSSIHIGAQNMNDATSGAFTGEVAADMLKDAGAEFVLLGHSERRKFFLESNEFINRKVLRALESDLQPLLCIGETFSEREENKTEEVLTKQIQECLQGVSIEKASKLVLCYEPVWAIGTGKAAIAEDVSKTHTFIRTLLSEMFSRDVSQKIPLLYGGSVSEKNAESFLLEKNIDGLLIGSASLHAETFAKIIELRQNTLKAKV